MSAVRYVSGLLGLLLATGLGLAAYWMASGMQASSATRPAVPPDAIVEIRLSAPAMYVVTNDAGSMRFGDLGVSRHGPPVEGITYGPDGLRVPATMFARLDGQLVVRQQGSYRWVFGPLDSRRIIQDETGQWVLHMEQDLPLTFRLDEAALRTARADVTDPQALALLDQAIQHLADAADPTAWRNGYRLRAERGPQVFIALQDALASLTMLIGDPAQPSALRDSLGLRGRAAVSGAASDTMFATEILTRAAYDEAKAAGVPREVLARVTQAEHAAGLARERGQHEEAVQHLLTGWQIAMQALPPATPTPAP